MRVAVLILDAEHPPDTAIMPLSPVSNGKGTTTCSYFTPGDKQLIYASTHLAGDACPPRPDRSQGYVWALYDSYDIFKTKAINPYDFGPNLENTVADYIGKHSPYKPYTDGRIVAAAVTTSAADAGKTATTATDTNTTAEAAA